MIRAAALVTAIALATSSGCSFALVKAPATAEPEPTTWPKCTEHYFWQVVDGAVAALALSGAVYFAQSDDQFATVGLAFEGGLAVGFGISAITGLGKTKRCRTARQAYERAAEQGR